MTDRSNDLPPPRRLPLLVLGFMSLIVGVLTGLVRLGWPPLPPGLVSFVPLHGPLMVCGFFGTLIGVERAVALGNRWGYIAPACTGAGALLLLLGAPFGAGAALVVFGSAGLVEASIRVYRRHAAMHTATLALGALAWLIGNVIWMADSVYAAVPWWSCFLVLTIAGERLELSRLLPPSPAAQRTFALLVGMLIIATGLSGGSGNGGRLLLAAVLIAVTVWLLRYDLARRTVHGQGLTRFMAVSLLSGYVWLLIGGGVGLASGGMFGPAAYGATLHAVFLGFVFSMVFGHAPVILPAVTGFTLSYHPAFYLHLALLHISLALRVGGDLAGHGEWRAIGGTLNAIAIAAFLINTVAAVVRGRRTDRMRT